MEAKIYPDPANFNPRLTLEEAKRFGVLQISPRFTTLADILNEQGWRRQYLPVDQQIKIIIGAGL